MNVKTKNIDGVEFTVAPFMAVEALRLKAYLFRTFGPAFGSAVGALKNLLASKGAVADMQIDGQALSLAIQTLMENMDEESFINLIKRMFASMTARGKDKAGKGFMRQFDDANFDASMNDVFQGRLFSVYPVLLLVLEANYPDFFAKTVRNIGELTKAMSTSGPENDTGTGESGKSDASES